MELTGRRIVVGVAGGIAAYKAAELVRALVKGGAEVRVVMTEAAQKFITPLTLQALSQHPVATDTFDLTQEATIGHIALADTAELLVIAPATADVIARLAHGLANDLLTTVALACRAPLLLAPAMNVNMWRHPATQANLRTLVERGAHTVGPDAGELACGWIGEGRMIEAADIAARLRRAARAARLGGTARARHRRADLRADRSGALFGQSLDGQDGLRHRGACGAARRRGHAGRRADGAGDAGRRHARRRARRRGRCARRRWRRVDGSAMVVMTAAVADYRPVEQATQKLKKDALGDAPELALTKNPDILAELKGRAPVVVGFAAETEDVERHAAEKLAQKGCDLIVANDVSEEGSGFGSDTNRVVLLARDGSVDRLPRLSKNEVADRILDRARALLGPTEAVA